MFNVGGPEILVVLLVALVVLGPDQLPKAMRTFGNVMAEVRKLSSGFQAEMRSAMESVESQAGTAQGGSPPAESPVTETVVRNDVPTTSGTGSAGASDGHRPPIDPADRAAG